MVLFDLLVNILGHNLAEPAYEAEVAQLEYKLVAGEHGLVIKVKGFNHKLPVSECIWRNQRYTNTCIKLHTDQSTNSISGNLSLTSTLSKKYTISQ